MSLMVKTVHNIHTYIHKKLKKLKITHLAGLTLLSHFQTNYPTTVGYIYTTMFLYVAFMSYNIAS